MSDSPIEEFHIQEFLSLVEGLELLDLKRQKPPEPDFYAETNFGLIGIEHTQLFKRPDQNKVLPSLHESEGDRLVSEAKKLFEEKSDAKIHVAISYRFEYGNNNRKNPIWLSSQKRKDLVPIVVDFVLQNIPKNGSFQGFENPDLFGRYVLPNEIFNISISNRSNLPTTYWSVSDGHVIPDIISESNFWELLEAKNKKVGQYNDQHDLLWLVLVSDNRKISSDFKMYNQELPKIQSPFDRVFIYMHGDKVYHELPKITG